MSATVIQHVLSRLHDFGIRDVFGVAGDFAFPVDDAVCSNKSLRWIGSCNELNAAYSADGHARIHGLAHDAAGPSCWSALTAPRRPQIGDVPPNVRQGKLIQDELELDKVLDGLIHNICCDR
jgi:hypothetical protein